MISWSDISGLFDSIDKWRNLAALPKQVAAMEAKIAKLERRLSHKEPLACGECGQAPVRIETKQWVSSFGSKMQTVRRVCDKCGRIEGRDVEIGQG